MAVYTQISPTELKEYLSSYDLGDLVSYEGIAQGVSNTNYFIDTTTGRYVLTLFEPRRVRAEDIPYFIDYAVCLEKNGVPCPETMVRRDGSTRGELCGRPAAIFSLLTGEGGSVSMLTSGLCEKAGAVLAKMHRAAEKFDQNAPNHFGLARWKDWAVQLDGSIDSVASGLQALTRSELSYVAQSWPDDLPKGAIHADYFPDNVFFKNGEVTGVIDFHFVCTDLFAFDLAIACNAWSFDADNHFHADRFDALMRGYQSVRPLDEAEKSAVPLLLRAASLRFLLSRIEEKLNWDPNSLGQPHDPLVFEKRLRHFQSMAGPSL